MRLCTHIAGLAAVFGVVLLTGCETTRNDVTAARNRVQREERRLEDVKRDAARNVEKERMEAREARTTNKPIVGDDFNEGATEEAREAQRKGLTESQRVQNQEERVRDAKVDAQNKENKLVMEQSRDKFLIDCKAAMDLGDRAIEKLQTMKNAADDAGQKAIDDRIGALKSKRDDLQKHINSIRSADVMHWTNHKAVAQKAMDELLKDAKSVL